MCAGGERVMLAVEMRAKALHHGAGGYERGETPTLERGRGQRWWRIWS
jgi:hypothetical protein